MSSQAPSLPAFGLPSLSLSLSLSLCIALSTVGCDKSKDAAPQGETPVAKAKDEAPAAKAAPRSPSTDLARPLAAVDVAVSDAAKAKAKEILGRVEDGMFADGDAEAANAEALVWIAATSTDPVIVGEALLAVADADQSIPAAYGPVLADRIGVENEAVLEGVDAALPWVLENALMAADETLVDTIEAAAKSHPNPAIARAAKGALVRLPVERPEVAAMIESLDASTPPDVVEHVLSELTLQRSDAVAQRAAAKETMLLSHPDPVIRGTAARRLGQHGDTKDPKVAEALAKLLDDDVPFVKCSAMEGLGSLRAKTAIAAVAKQLDGTDSCLHKFEEPTVSGENRPHTLGGSFTVGVRAALALQSISYGTSEVLKLGQVTSADESSQVAARKAARSWAASHG